MRLVHEAWLIRGEGGLLGLDEVVLLICGEDGVLRLGKLSGIVPRVVMIETKIVGRECGPWQRWCGCDGIGRALIKVWAGIGVWYEMGVLGRVARAWPGRS